jgi:sortase A
MILSKMQVLERLLLITGIICLGLYGFFTVQAKWHQADLERTFEENRTYEPLPAAPTPGIAAVPVLKEGDLVGRLEVPRLDLSVMVMEGIEEKTLRLGAGHVPGTALPGTAGNSGIAAHRDTFFLNLKDIKENDAIRFSTMRGVINYRVSSTMVVDPTDVEVLRPQSTEMITLVTCYPFYYVGPAPKRFVVQAVRTD